MKVYLSIWPSLCTLPSYDSLLVIYIHVCSLDMRIERMVHLA